MPRSSSPPEQGTVAKEVQLHQNEDYLSATGNFSIYPLAYSVLFASRTALSFLGEALEAQRTKNL